MSPRPAAQAAPSSRSRGMTPRPAAGRRSPRRCPTGRRPIRTGYPASRHGHGRDQDAAEGRGHRAGQPGARRAGFERIGLDGPSGSAGPASRRSSPRTRNSQAATQTNPAEPITANDDRQPNLCGQERDDRRRDHRADRGPRVEDPVAQAPIGGGQDPRRHPQRHRPVERLAHAQQGPAGDQQPEARHDRRRRRRQRPPGHRRRIRPAEVPAIDQVAGRAPGTARRSGRTPRGPSRSRRSTLIPNSALIGSPSSATVWRSM